jgi:hypothetical protein
MSPGEKVRMPKSVNRTVWSWNSGIFQDEGNFALLVRIFLHTGGFRCKGYAADIPLRDSFSASIVTAVEICLIMNKAKAVSHL